MPVAWMRHLQPRTHMTTLQSQEIKELDGTCPILNCRGRLLVPLRRLWKLLQAQDLFSCWCLVCIAAKTFNNLAWGYERKCSCPPITTDRCALFWIDFLIFWHTWLPFVTEFVQDLCICPPWVWLCHMDLQDMFYDMRVPTTDVLWLKSWFWGTCHQNSVTTSDYPMPKAFINSVTWRVATGHFWSFLHRSRCFIGEGIPGMYSRPAHQMHAFFSAKGKCDFMKHWAFQCKISHSHATLRNPLQRQPGRTRTVTQLLPEIDQLQKASK